MARNNTKTVKVMKLLKQGHSVQDISKLAKVSESYIYHLRKHGPSKPKATEDMKAALQLISQGEDMKEMAYDITQGRKERRVGSPERKVPGGPVTMVRPTAEDRVERILAKRNTRYGNFKDVAQVAQEMKNAIRMCNNSELEDDQIEALDMIASKIARILNGDPNYADSWIDIAGYATLVADRLEGKVQ
jgi:hypothetical protein